MLSTHPPRGPRGSTPQARGRGRGGIQKRTRADGPARVDKDGDLVMDAAATATQPRSGRGRIEPPTRAARPARTSSGPLSARTGPPGRGIQVSDRAKQSIMRGLGAKQANFHESRITTEGGTRLQVSGWKDSKAANNPDRGLESLLAFLERKAKDKDTKSNRAVKIKKSSMVGDSVFITASPQDIALIQKLDNFSFAGAILSIRVVDPPSRQTEEVSEETAKVKEQFKQVLYKRYNVDTKCLDLSALSNDAGLQQMGAFEAQNPHKIFPAMMAICDGLFENRQAKKAAIVSVLLTDNGLADVNVVNALANSFPDIKNIDLSRNNLADLKSLDAWRTKFRDLEVLVLAGNPVEGQLASLQTEIMKRYPRLHMLNNVVVRSPEQIAAIIAEAARLPFPISGPQFNDVGGVGATFVTAFLALYDTNRQALLTEYYDSNSTYSLAINMTAPRSTKVSVPVQPWAEYTKYSRNLNKINHLGARMNRRFKGVQAIQPVWANLPATQHPNLHTNADKYMIECQSTAGLPDLTGQAVGGVNGLTITIHGEFEDNTPNTTEKSLRSFSRTFVLGPGAPGGPQIRVVSDMLALRAWGPLPEPATAPPAPQQTMTPEEAELEQKKAIATQLMEKTGMTLEYSGMCLNAVEWDLQKAYDMFISNKANLPQEAWIDGIAR